MYVHVLGTSYKYEVCTYVPMYYVPRTFVNVYMYDHVAPRYYVRVHSTSMIYQLESLGAW